MKFAYLIVLVFVVCGRVVLAGQSKESNGELPLESVISEALARNPELWVLEADRAAAHGEVVTAKTWQNPELTVAPGMQGAIRSMSSACAAWAGGARAVAFTSLRSRDADRVN